MGLGLANYRCVCSPPDEVRIHVTYDHALDGECLVEPCISATGVKKCRVFRPTGEPIAKKKYIMSFEKAIPDAVFKGESK